MKMSFKIEAEIGNYQIDDCQLWTWRGGDERSAVLAGSDNHGSGFVGNGT